MEIDLSRVIGYSKDSLQSRALMRAIMLDLYPGRTLEMNVLLDVYESGVPRKIKNDGAITEAQYAQYIQKIKNEYGLQESYIVEALNAWVDIYLGEGTSSQISYFQKDQTANTMTTSFGLRPLQHAHNQLINNPKNYSGNNNDYEIRILSPNTIEISKYLGFDEATTIIPNEIDGKRVVGIGASAFSKCKGLQVLFISEGIEYIGEAAFECCSNLQKVQLPASLKKIGEKAFSQTDLKTIDLPNGIKKIEDYTFYYCKNLQTIIWADYLTEIGAHSFRLCSSLKSIRLPASVRKIGSGAFCGCISLINAELNEGLAEIDREAFKQCNSLKQITIPSSVTRFGQSIFKGDNAFQTPDITLFCYPKSKAIEYARINNLEIKSAI